MAMNITNDKEHGEAMDALDDLVYVKKDTSEKGKKQAELLEDSIRIYEETRFGVTHKIYEIDVGDMPPEQVEEYLATVKKEFNTKSGIKPGTVNE